MLLNSQIEIIILVVFGIWLSAITFFLFSFFSFFNKLVKGEKGESLKALLERIFSTQSENSQNIAGIVKEVRRLEEEGKFHIQKVGLIRFNPFKEIGGDHSFALALLDGKNTGIIVTILHTRERTRIYAKNVREGKSELELSEEERKALARAQRQ